MTISSINFSPRCGTQFRLLRHRVGTAEAIVRAYRWSGVCGRTPGVDAFLFMHCKNTKCRDVDRDPMEGFYRIIYTYFIVARIIVRLCGLERVTPTGADCMVKSMLTLSTVQPSKSASILHIFISKCATAAVHDVIWCMILATE